MLRVPCAGAARAVSLPGMGDVSRPWKVQWEPTEQREGTGSAGRGTGSMRPRGQRAQQISRLERPLAAIGEGWAQGVLIFL